ncbi:MAG: FHIPEP family type III secretion protein [Proteobacteria bacterium]|nr:FHIPEP family type III secretion protein [Pseudomonadota bacterium]
MGGFGAYLRQNSDLVIVSAVIGILVILFAPISTPLLDFMIVLNFAFAITILLLTFYVVKPVEFSTFPSLLLVATLFRLSLNVAATRLILTDGFAGDVIAAVGSFAVGGNAVIGLVVFFILIVVQYVVVTAGAQRVSEVAARFTLDSVPGQQMSIDSDLNMGLIDQDEAKARRRGLEREAAFYGAMDGASKFVKGDAVAGIVIVLINIVAGWIVGIVQQGLEWPEALHQYTLLTIGDGIVTQVPALVISVATGIIVTRSSADGRLSAEVLAQLSSVPKIALIVMAALVLLLLLPGMPKWPIAILLLAMAVAWLTLRNKADRSAENTPEDEALHGDAGATRSVVVELGSELHALWTPSLALIEDRLDALRLQIRETLGLEIPSIGIERSTKLAAFDYGIALFGSRVAASTIRPDELLAIRPANARGSINGVEAREPAFGLPALWVENGQRDAAQDAGYTLVDPVTVMMTHLGEIVKNEAPLLLTRRIVVAMLEGTRARQPGLVEELVPAIMSVSDVQRVLEHLLAEEVSLRNIDGIAEILVDVGRQTKDHAELTELVRKKLSYQICNDLRGRHESLSVLSLDPRLEAQISENIGQSDGGGAFVIEPGVAEGLIRKSLALTESMLHQGLAPVLLCGPVVRRHLRAFMRRSIPRMAIISVNEVPHTVNLTSFGVVKIEQNASK